MEPGGGADRDRARPAGGSGSGRAECARGAARAGAGPDRGRPDRARGRRLRHARALLGGRATRRNGASADCWRACTPTPSSACARRSSRWRRATSCASCSPGSASPTMRAWKGPMRSTRWSGSSKASARRPEPGRPRSCPRASPATSRPGSTTAAWQDAWPGRGSGPAADARTAASAAPRRCAPRRSRCWRVRNVPLWTSLNAKAEPVQPSPRAQQVVDFLRQHGASFFDEMAAGSGLLRSQLEEALAELVALGLVTSDSFAGLRALLVPSDRRQSANGARRRRRAVPFGMEGAGRWALVRRAPPAQPASGSDSEAVEHLARTLLRRYGVVFWRLLEREAGWLPPWRDLLRVYRTLERRGEIRGGRFVAGFSGEQFALPEAVGALREVAAQAAVRRAGLAVRRRPAQPRGHPDAGGEARGADRQPRALSRRAAGRPAGGRRGAVPGDAGARHRMAGPHRPAALGHADRVRPPGLVSRGRGFATPRSPARWRSRRDRR